MFNTRTPGLMNKRNLRPGEVLLDDMQDDHVVPFADHQKKEAKNMTENKIDSRLLKLVMNAYQMGIDTGQGKNKSGAFGDNIANLIDAHIDELVRIKNDTTEKSVTIKINADTESFKKTTDGIKESLKLSAQTLPELGAGISNSDVPDGLKVIAGSKDQFGAYVDALEDSDGNVYWRSERKGSTADA